MTPKRILVAADFSPAADLAVRRAVALARRYKAELRLVHAVPPLRSLEGLFPSRRKWKEEVSARAAAALKAQAKRLVTDKRIDVSTGLLSGRASAAIAGAVADFQPDLLVMGARGEGRLPSTKSGLGGTATKLIRSTEVPLLLVRRPEIDLPRKVLVALDLTPASASVARWANSIAAGGELTAVHVFEAPFAERLRVYGVSRKTIDVYAADQSADLEQAMRTILAGADIDNRVNCLVLRGEARRVISAQLRKLNIATLVMGKHTRRKGSATAPDGSVCRYLAYFAPVDVLVVP